MTELLTTDSILYGAAGIGAGYAIGWMIKKAMKVLFKLAMVMVVLFVTALVYLQSIKVIYINERALDNLMAEGYDKINQTIGQEAIVNPMQYVITTLGLPMSGGLAMGLLMGWLKG